MNEHYSGNDPETGCALIALTAALVVVILIILGGAALMAFGVHL